jgi:hypothetical protein
MEKGEGIALAKQWKISAFPTLIYLDSKGEEIHRKLGGSYPEQVVEAGKIAIRGKGIATFTSQFNKGDRNDTFINEYLLALKKARKTDEMESVVTTVLNEREKSEWSNAKNWILFDKYFASIYTTIAEYFLSHRDQYIKSVGKEAVNAKVMHLYKKEMFNIMTYDKKTDSRSIITEAYDKFVASLDKNNIVLKDLILTDINFTMAGNDMEKCISIVEAYIKKDKSVIGTEQMYEWSCLIRRKAYDPEVVKKSDEWFKMTIANTDSEKLKKKCKDLMEGKTWNPYGTFMLPAIGGGMKKAIKK